MQNQWNLVCKDGEHPTQFTMRILRAHVLEEAIREVALTANKSKIEQALKNKIILHLEDLIQKGN